MAITRVQIKELLKEWAFATTDLHDEAISGIIQNNKWLQPTYKFYLQPTVKQLGNFAQKLHIPFGSLLLTEPPKQEDIRLAFRTQENAPAQVSLTVRDVIYEMKRKQAWFKEESGLTQKLSLIGSAKGMDNDQTLNAVKDLLVLKYFSTARDLYDGLRDQLAHLGILNMQKGGAGISTRRPLDVKELRAFVLLDDYAPLIFINQKDSYTTRIFSLIHEFVHILDGSDELLSGKDKDIVEERNINKVVAAFLMPEQAFKRIFDPDKPIKTAHHFDTSPEATAIRAQQLGLVQNADDLAFPPIPPDVKRDGGNSYNNALSLNDKRFMNTLIAAQERGSVQPTQAASLIGISYKMLDRTVETFNEREAFI
jgi:Zn-dependent peptidase ImmA (M78 family)